MFDLIFYLSVCLSVICLMSYPLKFYIFLVIICTVLLICRQNSFPANRALKVELKGFCLHTVTWAFAFISFMHIHHTSPLIFFMFFHSPQPATRYVSMSVCQVAHTLSYFFVLLPSFFLSFCLSFTSR